MRSSAARSAMAAAGSGAPGQRGISVRVDAFGEAEAHHQHLDGLIRAADGSLGRRDRSRESRQHRAKPRGNGLPRWPNGCRRASAGHERLGRRRHSRHSASIPSCGGFRRRSGRGWKLRTRRSRRAAQISSVARYISCEASGEGMPRSRPRAARSPKRVPGSIVSWYSERWSMAMASARSSSDRQSASVWPWRA